MYNLVYLPVARRDMIEIARYISVELKNPAAANQLATELIDAGDSILKFPYASPTYTPIRPLKHEYRKLIVQNYIMFYWIDESNKQITVARVIYARRDFDRLLK